MEYFTPDVDSIDGFPLGEMSLIQLFYCQTPTNQGPELHNMEISNEKEDRRHNL